MGFRIWTVLKVGVPPMGDSMKSRLSSNMLSFGGFAMAKEFKSSENGLNEKKNFVAFTYSSSEVLKMD